MFPRVFSAHELDRSLRAPIFRTRPTFGGNSNGSCVAGKTGPPVQKGIDDQEGAHPESQPRMPFDAQPGFAGPAVGGAEPGRRDSPERPGPIPGSRHFLLAPARAALRTTPPSGAAHPSAPASDRSVLSRLGPETSHALRDPAGSRRTFWPLRPTIPPADVPSRRPSASPEAR